MFCPIVPIYIYAMKTSVDFYIYIKKWLWTVKIKELFGNCWKKVVNTKKREKKWKDNRIFAQRNKNDMMTFRKKKPIMSRMCIYGMDDMIKIWLALSGPETLPKKKNNNEAAVFQESMLTKEHNPDFS